MRRITEVVQAGEIPLWRHPEWMERFPWLIQGTTGRGNPGREIDREVDFGLFGRTPVGATVDRWRQLRAATGLPTVVHSRQVHGAAVADWSAPLPAGLMVTEGSDAHLSRRPGTLLTVSVADCVPVFLVSDSIRAVAIAHAGWRGIAAGVVDAALRDLVAAGASLEGLWVHCGPAICGGCYEVGPEVHQAVRPAVPPPSANQPIDLVEAITERVLRAGIEASRISASDHCTLCGPGHFFSHRGGSSGRQIGVIGVRP